MSTVASRSMETGKKQGKKPWANNKCQAYTRALNWPFRGR